MSTNATKIHDKFAYYQPKIKESFSMNELTIIRHNGGAYVDSREVAEIIGKRHDNLLRDIAGYLRIFDNSIALKIEGNKLFVESYYTDSRGRVLPCYLLTKAGCSMVANKLTGEKGVMFTAAYVLRFEELETAEKDAEIAAYHPKLNTATAFTFPQTAPEATSPDSTRR
ncbi:hypothetical protein FACS1894105_11070 [Clostridia bacterium]|nr:hypothetical protein FACS1894105_11070 [Clostridia bacterium]